MKEIFSVEHNKQLTSIWNEPKIKDFLIDREIKPEDKPLIERLAEFPQRLFLDYHNFFSSEKEKTLETLQRRLQNRKAEVSPSYMKLQDRTEECGFLTAWIAVAEKYPWYVCWHLNGILEKRKK
jgi:hypothetical protein